MQMKKLGVKKSVQGKSKVILLKVKTKGLSSDFKETEKLRKLDSLHTLLMADKTTGRCVKLVTKEVKAKGLSDNFEKKKK